MEKVFFKTFYKCNGMYYSKTFRVPKEQVANENLQDGQDLVLNSTISMSEPDCMIIELHKIVGSFTNHLSNQKGAPCEILRCTHYVNNPE